MATLTLKIPDALLRQARKRLNGGLQDYLLNALTALTADELPINAELECELREGLNSPRIELTEAYWKAKIRRFESQHRKSQRG